MLALPMCLLFEAGLFLARFISVRRKEQSDYKAESG
jgi:Sec-independent protein secretion pathway component TatC